MFYRTKTNSKGKIRYEVVEKYKDPLIGKWKTAIISYYKNSSRARKQAELELIEKIETLQEKTKSSFSASEIKTFGELKESWFNSWSVSVKNKQLIENIDFSTHQFFTSKHSKMASEMIETSKAEKIVLTVQEFREKLHLSNSYQPRHISANILPKIKKNLQKFILILNF
ncbi:hypothetical protein [Streptococcus suis]|uniref:hypothetical protein n=1 Tax=Streptococcus suis TaxID=1307 RepID=UPI00040521A7|nr:hypothetical protein [Streptococcus suis]HEL1643486.1 hypothetical protein [Streptococcus suis]HEL2002480.1 hypothetical protein [Streptococcus suis]HEM5042316.1 hypothetical protein [Streptococcus suis]HEM6017528.1 hypothetical protein [Streptococcus suis]